MAFKYLKEELCLSTAVWAVITKHHALDGLNNKHLFLTVLVAAKSKIKVLADLMSGEGHLPGLQRQPPAILLYIFTWWEGERERERANVLWSLLIKALIPSWRLHPS